LYLVIPESCFYFPGADIVTELEKIMKIYEGLSL